MTFVAIPSVRHAQIVALTGLDGIIIDCEHGHVGDDSVHNSVAAISALGVSPIIRIRGPTHDIIKRALTLEPVASWYRKSTMPRRRSRSWRRQNSHPRV
ncbi:hypothetical protein F5Y03DRAFT_377807 [Xylaria venustula]|nr:hypothetical protein F5Y03DRAFT_377807 [Xylaria venustula]